MTADLKALHAPPHPALTSVQLHSRLSKTIAALYVLTQLAVSLGVGFALFQNWTLRLESVQSNLVRNANMGNFLMESALTSATKSLKNTQTSFQQALQTGTISQRLASQMLYTSDASFRRYNKTETFGLLFYVDKSGMLYAQSNGVSETTIDVSDRLYFSQLRNRPQVQVAVGPLVVARNTGQWVFHISVPFYDPSGEFHGVLVQQILVNDIAAKLKAFVDTAQFEQMVTQYDGIDPSFFFPPPGYSEAPDSKFLVAWSRRKKLEVPNNGLFIWDGQTFGLAGKLLLGIATSPTYALTTFVSFPVSRLHHDFWVGNLVLLLYWVFGVFFVTAIFYYVYKLSRKLAKAQLESLHDALTTLSNRRALDETLPHLLRESVRSQAPISVLFVDIDHFRYFNENYGHESGDIALTMVAHALRACARRPLDFVCRWGGEEFVLVLPQTNRLAAQAMADRVLVAIRAIELQSINGSHPKLTVSVGHVTAIMATNGPQEDLVDDADKAMLQAKSRGRNQRAEYVPVGYSDASRPADRFTV